MSQRLNYSLSDLVLLNGEQCWDSLQFGPPVYDGEPLGLLH